MNHEQMSKMFKALAEPNRIKIIELLSTGPMCACEVLDHFDFTQPTLSHHMKVLESVGIVSVERDRKWHYYFLKKEETSELLKAMQDLFPD
ncbi:ArsR/SmtB family transcription factor [Candidatus Enterococcus courvalinii]|uniref:Winged helix-turn-helix transcriptional regulator n=1 Tax=Candidatus Enterococcus courvalinii TaxID=2815329 RepID=A0ABS3I160_9ENTE|nr:metalloregulator ArsR/SmtB family transcription factor [Enterococcus sp. MSG2901]MBO0482453.1 winged helix-turn-helix transcriptional regulator [Enterococcus sp. MSG2901]